MKSSDWSRVEFFTPGEFRHPEKMSAQFIFWLDELRRRVGMPIVITSSYRSPVYNASVGGAKDSAHTDVPCCAVDIGERPRADDPNWNRTRWAIVSAAIAMGCRRIGLYADGSIHLDMTHDRRPADRIWRVVGALKR